MKIAIFGYGNLGHAAEIAAAQADDVSACTVFSRRTKKTSVSGQGNPLCPASDIARYRGSFDVLLLCAGSADDLPVLTPRLARSFDLVDSFDNHARFRNHLETVRREAERFGHLSLVGGGWDPGLFSLTRLLFDAFLPNGNTVTFWGPGVSQGHSEAVRRMPDVRDAKAFTLPDEDALKKAEAGEPVCASADRLHRRAVFAVPERNADLASIRRRIVSLPHYFEGYPTDITFLTENELTRRFGGYPHGGNVIRNGTSGASGEHSQSLSLRLRLESNPEFTAGILLCCARAVFRMKMRGRIGCLTMADVPPADYSPLDASEIPEKVM